VNDFPQSELSEIIQWRWASEQQKSNIPGEELAKFYYALKDLPYCITMHEIIK
jgi:hypothetical protein